MCVPGEWPHARLDGRSRMRFREALRAGEGDPQLVGLRRSTWEGAMASMALAALGAVSENGGA